jgi:hypothetical protein
MAAPIDRSQVLNALRMADPSKSSYLDLETGAVIYIDDTATDPETEAQRTAIMEGYGDRYRYVSGGNADADEAAVQAWLDGEGL